MECNGAARRAQVQRSRNTCHSAEWNGVDFRRQIQIPNCTGAGSMDKQFINPEGLVKPGAYTPVVSVSGGRTLYISGQVSQDAQGQLVGKGDLLAQTEQVYKNLATALAGAGATFADVVKLTVFVVNYQPEHRALLQSRSKSLVQRRR